MTTKAYSENRRLARSRALLAGCFTVALLAHLDLPDAAAQARLYDNAAHLFSKPHTGPRNIIWTGISQPGGFDAQPFKLGGHDNVASVSIPMARGPIATATGMIRFSIWDDNGRGFPGQEVGELGILDIESLPIFDFPDQYDAI